jgi:predicted ATPase
MEISANNSQEIKRISMIQRPSLTHEKHLSVMGEPLLFQTNYPPFLETAVQAFGRFPPANSTSRPPLVLQLFIHSPADNTDDKEPTLTVRSHRHLLTLTAGKNNFVVADLQQGFTYGYITQSLAQNLEYVRYTFIESAVQAMLGLSRGFVAIHAAAVVKNDTCLLLCGPSGTGKSTLAYACLRQGYQLLSEDVVQANVAGDELALWGMPWKCHLMAESLPFFPELQGKTERLQVNGKMKVPLDLAETHPQSMVTLARNGRLIFMDKSQPDCPAALSPLSPAETRANFEVIWSWEGGWQVQYEERLNDLLAAGAYHLQLGRTPNESIQALEQLFTYETSLRNPRPARLRRR